MKMVLKLLKEKDIKKNYLEWFLDTEVVKFSDNQYEKFTINKEKKYVRNCILSRNVDLYGIFAEEKLIGNICINGLSSKHKRAEISYLIGDRRYWNKGAGTFAIREISKKALNYYKLNKLFAGVAEENIASIKVLEKNNFILEGTRSNHLYYNGKFYNQLDYGLVLKN